MPMLCLGLCCHCRDMNQETSQEVFVGPYLDDPVVKEKFSVAYRNMTDAFLVSHGRFGLLEGRECVMVCHE